MINTFKGTPLSNFWNSKITIERYTYKNVEAAFQSFKVFGDDRLQFATLDPATAKKEGRRVALRSDWELIKDTVMYKCLKAKFSNEDMKSYLLSTGDKQLVEGNWWHDNEWGDCNCDRCKKRIGENKLGNMLMKIREDLK